MSKDCPVFISYEQQHNSSVTVIDFIILQLHTIDRFAQLRYQLPADECKKLLAVKDPSIAKKLGDFQMVHSVAIAEAKKEWIRNTYDNLEVMEMKGYYSDIKHAQTPSDFEFVYNLIRDLEDKVLTRVAKNIGSYNFAVATKNTHLMGCAICNPSLVPEEVLHVFEQM